MEGRREKRKERDLNKLTKIERLNFPLWENKWIVFEKRPFGDRTAKDLAERGIIFLKDLLDPDGNLGEPEALCEEYGLTHPHAILTRLLVSIPEPLLSREGEVEDVSSRTWENLHVQGRKWNRLPSRSLSEEPHGIAKCRIEWEREGLKLNWEKAWKAVWKTPVPPKWNEIYFLLLHRTLWVGAKAARLGIDYIPAECYNCDKPETLRHLFWDCLRARTARQEAKKKWITFGDMLADQSREQRAVLYTIWKDRCEDGFEGNLVAPEKVTNTLKNIIKTL